jgi:threonine synthase
MNNVLGYVCAICGDEFEPGALEYVCPKHGDAGVLDTRYDYAAIARQIDPRRLAEQQAPSMLNMFRYRALLPIDSESRGLPLQIGWTPLYRATRLEPALGLREVWLKDDGRNPTASFKDRASALVVTRALEDRRRVITTASSGNAGAALAGMAASVKMPAVIFVPESAPQAKVAQLLIYGSTVFLVKGNYDAAFELCLEASRAFGWYCRNTAYNPFTVEGKKTAALEICEQLEWRAPDRIFVSVGDGNIIAGLHKGLSDLHQLGWIDAPPKLMGVQAQGAAACYNAWVSGAEEVTAVQAQTLADSISVDLPRDGRRALRAVRETGGAFITVGDDQILAALRDLAQEAAVFVEPAAATAYAGLQAALRAGQVGPDERVAVVLTGNGLKDVSAAMRATTPAYHIEPDLAALRRVVDGLGIGA